MSKRYGGTESNRLMEESYNKKDSTGYELKTMFWSLLVCIISVVIMISIHIFATFTLFYCIVFDVAMFISGVSFVLAYLSGMDYFKYKEK